MDKLKHVIPYWTAMVAVAALVCPAILMISGMFPDGVLVDNKTFIWLTPPTNPGADPAYVTVPATPPTVAVVLANWARVVTTMSSTEPVNPGGSVTPPPVK